MLLVKYFKANATEVNISKNLIQYRLAQAPMSISYEIKCDIF